MTFEFHGEYLVSNDQIGRLSKGGIVSRLQREEGLGIRDLSNKERALHFNGFVVTDEQNNVIFEDRKRYAPHFFPLSVLDYAKALYQFERSGQQIPILSIDSHDVLKCDFKCQDCLSSHGTSFPFKTFPPDNFKMDLETYKAILQSVADYSRKRGFVGVRFEQSGEGNPDYYKHRKQLLGHAKELGMRSVYVSTGSKIDDSLMRALVENSSFIRISFPGIGESYQRYSRQDSFTYDHAINLLKKMVREREKLGRSRDLMIGARVALREDHGDSYSSFGSILKGLGLDVMQVVKILVPEGRKRSEFPLSRKDKTDLEKTTELENGEFNVTIPHKLDYMVYSREIEDRSEFPSQCFSALFQPVLTGRSLFVCTISNVMYDHNLRLGTFEKGEGELEKFLTPTNVRQVMKGIPARCNCCSNIYDNMLLFSLQKLFRKNRGKLKFYEIIK